MTRSLRSTHRSTWIAVVCALLSLALPVLAFAHAVVFPKASTLGGYERYVLRVPNEKTSATTRVEIHFPAEVRVTAFEDVPGWQLEVLTDSAKRIIGAVWTGNLPPQRFVELPFMAANPKEGAASLTWPAYQTYADGERVEWTGPEGSKSPASVTTLSAAAAPTRIGGTSPAEPPRWITWVALVVAFVSLGFALRRPETR
jgi:uncharacterized protein YcnI